MGSMIAETKLATENQPRILVKEFVEVECRKFCILYANIEAHVHMGSCPGYPLLILHGKATKPHESEFREGIGRIVVRTLAGKVRREVWQEKPG